jgi:hypothetical protein
MKKIFVSIVVLIVILACGGTPVQPTADAGAVSTIVANTAGAAQNQTAAAIPTLTNAPTNTPVPTNTPEPTATTNPNLISAGTYLVGVDIQPGIYKGISSDCYWERLSDLSGDLSGILANGNTDGQFYVEVLGSDKAFKVSCRMERLVTLPPAVSSFPSKIGSGTYLVNIEIQPGTYRGDAGADILSSCYWERLSKVDGTLSGILANENATGQFYVQVSGPDFALHTSCDLERVSD